jgi:drug/metabolite transporter (DMT)-like permease
MPLAETMAITFISPVLTAVLSGPLLGEKVRPAVWGASLAALSGVILILRPNVFELGWQATLPLISAVFFSLMIILNRASAGKGSALAMQTYMACVAAPILAIAAVAAKFSGLPEYQFGWPQWDVVARCAVVAVTATTAHWLAYLGTMRAGASQVAPASYVQMLVATTLGWWWFGNVPDLITFAGAAVIIGAGLYLWRDSRKAVRSTAI